MFGDVAGQVKAPGLVKACTTAWNELTAFNEPTAQTSVCAAPTPWIEQLPVCVDHVRFAPDGSGSLIATPVAVPGQLLVKSLVKVRVCPAVIVALDGCLEIASTGVWHAMLPTP